ncbi:Protein RALF-like 34 [Acorus gramineus]|uniref:Protein RALF-like 34 n=1 Tax=Acorus gramineus TaxID=55184 RepID=A0AAV9BH30_ACOGR|nr:Protein RALF-like 34 [Acorus gramineus]
MASLLLNLSLLLLLIITTTSAQLEWPSTTTATSTYYPYSDHTIDEEASGRITIGEEEEGMGRSYYTHHCYRARGPVNPRTRGCSAITRCRR